MIKVGDFVRARLVVESQGSFINYGVRKEGIYLRKRSDTVTIDLLDADTLDKFSAGEITEIEVKPDMLHRCWLNGATLVQDPNSPHITKEQIAILRAALK